MRTLKRRPDSGNADEGAVMVWVALMIVVLLGVGALVIDVGALLVERRQLQNGADAAALAVAQDCALGDCGSGGGAGVAKQYADLNAGDDVSAIGSGTPCGVGPGLSGCAEPAPSDASDATGWVRVNTSTETQSGDDEVSFLLAPLISALTGKTVHAGAVAAWGPAGHAATLPFTFSECEFWTVFPGGKLIPGTDTTIYSKAGNQNQEPLVPDCEPRSSAGGTVEGGFGWLNVSGGTCTANLTLGQSVTGPGDPGNNNLLKKAACSESLALIQNGEEILLPLFNSVTGQGANAVYTIAGFVGFVVEGYSLSGSTFPSIFSCKPPPGANGNGGNLRCFYGHFTETYIDAGDFGGSINFGVSVIKMVG
jgi:hypothetical protein